MIALVDPSDEGYAAQRALVDGDAAFFVTEMLVPSDLAVAGRAAETVAVLTQHSAHARARLASGPLVGLDSSVERVSLNPCQAGAYRGDGGVRAALLAGSRAPRPAAALPCMAFLLLLPLLLRQSSVTALASILPTPALRAHTTPPCCRSHALLQTLWIAGRWQHWSPSCSLATTL